MPQLISINSFAELEALTLRFCRKVNIISHHLSVLYYSHLNGFHKIERLLSYSIDLIHILLLPAAMLLTFFALSFLAEDLKVDLVHLPHLYGLCVCARFPNIWFMGKRERRKKLSVQLILFPHLLSIFHEFIIVITWMSRNCLQWHRMPD